MIRKSEYVRACRICEQLLVFLALAVVWAVFAFPVARLLQRLLDVERFWPVYFCVWPVLAVGRYVLYRCGWKVFDGEDGK